MSVALFPVVNCNPKSRPSSCCIMLHHAAQACPSPPKRIPVKLRPHSMNRLLTDYRWCGASPQKISQPQNHIRPGPRTHATARRQSSTSPPPPSERHTILPKIWRMILLGVVHYGHTRNPHTLDATRSPCFAILNKTMNGRPTDGTDRTEGMGAMRRLKVCCVVRAFSAFRGPLGTLPVQATAESSQCLGT